MECLRGELRADVASFLIRLYLAQDYEGDYVHLLMEWFAFLVGEDPTSVSIVAEPHGINNKIGLRVFLGRSEQGLAIPVPASVSHAQRVKEFNGKVRAFWRLAPRGTPAPAKVDTRRTPVNGPRLGLGLHVATPPLHSIVVPRN
jgi:hypothetical protein